MLATQSRRAKLLHSANTWELELMKTLRLKAPAKINLYLNVINKRPDGYHDIETVFERLDLCDEITLTKRKSGVKVICRHKGVPQGEKNLAARAARALLKLADCSSGVQIRIVKKIPVASGLGGASSDAAAVLSGLNKLLVLKQSRGQLLRLATQLGADVPFFLLSAPRAIGRGRGDVLTKLSSRWKRKNWYILVLPYGLAVSTRRMYQALRITLTKRPSGVKIIARALEEGDLSTLNKYSYNSFELLLIKKYKEIQKIKQALQSLGAGATLMSGSGPCVFAICPTRKEAMAIKEQLRLKQRGWQTIVAQTYFNSKKED